MFLDFVLNNLLETTQNYCLEQSVGSMKSCLQNIFFFIPKSEVLNFCNVEHILCYDKCLIIYLHKDTFKSVQLEELTLCKLRIKNTFKIVDISNENIGSNYQWIDHGQSSIIFSLIYIEKE
ncbi:hypothetical protein V1477_007783 [Vespula maculifrons]|uniref:Uncharacterized protein n=1 Tax=Vespula maculifrons TaxID=7453 RepID=A0ABD2CFQ6_VESMC